ncbi:MAG: disulfide bond formation protein B [Patescibacteria group bacterium]
MSIVQINLVLSILALLGQVFVIILLVFLLFFRKSQSKLAKVMSSSFVPLAFIVALVATGGSLYYSQIAKFTPCELCWFQRIFIYPQVILLGMAWFKKEKYILDYSLVMIAVGTIISVYHNYIYYTAKPSGVCSIVAPCTQQYIVGLDYVTIPLLALTSLILMGLLLLSKKIIKT